MAQIQGNLWILDRSWCDFIVYDPRVIMEDLRMHTVRVKRDDEYIEKIAEAVDRALVYYGAMLKQLGLTFEDVLNVKYKA